MIRYEFTAQLDAGTNGIPVQVSVEYDGEKDPLAVEMIISEETMDAPVTWIFARDLLVQATNRLDIAGDGDIKFQMAADGELKMCMRNPCGHADFYLPTDQIRDFLAETTVEAAIAYDSVSGALDDFLKEVLG